jgi:hypothetical protein
MIAPGLHHSETDMIPPLTKGEAREYNRHEARMNTNTIQKRKEVTTLDADVPLLRPALTVYNVSELRMFKQKADAGLARHILSGAV